MIRVEESGDRPQGVVAMTGGMIGGHGPLAHHFDTLDQQQDAGKLGMWLFLATEVLLFAGLFCLYAVYRITQPEIFRYGNHYLNPGWGAINTVVLLLSSFTMAMAVWAARCNQKRDLVLFLALTLLCGVDFLGIKLIEYSHKFHDNLTWSAAAYAAPGPIFAAATPPSGASPVVAPEAASGVLPDAAAAHSASPATAKTGDATRGRSLFRNTCAACHGLRGEGVSGQGKDMRGSEFIAKLDDAGLVAFIQRGRMPNDPASTTGRMMPPRGGNMMLTEAELFDIAAFVRQLTRNPAPSSGSGSAQKATPVTGGTSGGPSARDSAHGSVAAGTQATGDAAPSTASPADSAAGALSADDEPPLIERSIMPLAAEGPPGLRPEFFAAEARRMDIVPPLPHGDPGRPANLHLFFGLYFCMTGLHGLHVVAGMSVIAWLLARSLRGEFNSEYYAPVDLGGLYWHLVDVIWIFLFPLLYLIH
ncbi:MAG: cytochrome c oxidase subunit 3 [Planctomycetia bacterium]|nr:MAG: cytochrome c oxidase subunit 3 [Planctomycetia bacterium]